ncbi:acyltransferase family protein [Amycolatopsis taiwanensis]|uniref:Acyltransferase 3 domain-containing protein n=1 Tax=Amycolatopsis taiwanensis TaxID=342230 RepID=A0A9W6VGH5_9PSEU|nr:acyltransferase [Amycolatopsis taiwanensis]GLY65496.1 hypothetical protein Atai01_21150 [Amycolatopsis taiwanensis]
MSERAGQTPRELSVDLYRVVAILVVVAGHWLAASITFRDGRFGDENVLASMPWTQWMTWLFQVIPVFFLVAGYAGAASWARWPGRWPGWLRHRLAAVLTPTTVYVAVMLAVVAALRRSTVDPSQLAFGAWALAFHLWFLPVYLLLVSVTPLAVAAQRRWGLAVPAVLALVVGAIDVAALAGGVPAAGSVNYLLGWAAVYQLGVAWCTGALRGARPALLAAGAVAVLAVLLWLGPYPASMVGVPGEAVRNTSPPNFALIAFSAAQAGLLVMAASAVTARLRHSSRRRVLAPANRTVMAVYLWHMVPVAVVALAAYPGGLLPQPVLGSAGWWVTRVPWLTGLIVVMAVVLLPLALAQPRLTRYVSALAERVPIRLYGPVLLVGAAISAFALYRFAIDGFAPDGQFPTLTTVVYVVGVTLATFGRAEPQSERGVVAERAGRG